MLTFDRYLLRNFTYVFVVCFMATFGLMVVIDLLENLDEFLIRNRDGTQWRLVENIVRYYAIQSVFFFDRAGPSLCVVAVIVVLILLQRSGELHPMLAAGVPMYRVLFPLLCATAVVSAALVANQEFLVPQFVQHAHGARGHGETKEVESTYDYATRISIDGGALVMTERTILNAEFVLPAPQLVADLTILKAEKAIQQSAGPARPAGWLLQGTDPAPEILTKNLTPEGLKIIEFYPDGDVFVATAVTSDQLYRKNSNYWLLSTKELINRIGNAAVGPVSVHRMILHLHTRVVQPLMNLIAVLLVIPLMVRKESRGLVADSAYTLGVMGAMFGVMQACQFLGVSKQIAPELSAWGPVIFGGSLSAWLSGYVRS